MVPQSQKVAKTFSAVFADQTQTRTMVDGVAGDAARNTVWLPGDAIAVLADGTSTPELFHNMLQENSTRATFAGSVTMADKYFALYPYQVTASVNGTNLSVNLPAVQQYAVQSFGQNAMPMVAKVESGEELYFKNLCGGFILNITGTEVIKTIQFTGYDDSGNRMKVAGDYLVDMSYSDAPALVGTGSSNTSVTLNCGDGVQLSENAATSFHLVLPPATYNGFDVIITTTDGKRMKKGVNKQLVIKRANLTNAAAFAFEENFFGFNLSEKGTANCYIVPMDGFYYFDASVIGNGEFGMKFRAEGAWAGTEFYHTDSPDISPVSAEILWQTKDEPISELSYLNGQISFTASGAEGNALIVAKEADGTILWSWHIWCTDQPVEHLYVNSTGSYTVLDRNLGAIRADRGTGEQWKESVGTLYQYGRKDPFCFENHNASKHYTEINTRLSVKETVQMPNAFAYGNSSWNTDGFCQVTWQKDKKMVYDPCPPGYRVAVNDIWESFINNGQTTDRVADLNVSGSYDYGWNFIYDGVNTAWYPAGIWIGYWGGYSENSEEGYVWGVDGYATNKLRYWYRSDYESHFNLRHGEDPVCAYPVRCMKDEDINPIIITTYQVGEKTSNSAKVSGRLSVYGDVNIVETGFVYGTSESVTIDNGTVVSVGDSAGTLNAELTGLSALTRYYVRAYVTTASGTSYADPVSFITPNAEGVVDLSVGGTANCYMVYPVQGTYTFDLVQGNSSTSVGKVASVEVLWETFNTSDSVSAGAVIESVELDGTRAKFTIPQEANSGNALIAAKNSAGTILWSWHIWVVDMDPDSKGVVYPSGYKFMDRNLGALSAVSSDVRSFGFLYQWGRKDPFVGSDGGETFAKTTLSDKSYIESGSDTNTKAYAVSHPTTVISYSTWNSDPTLWGIDKTIYDPCPAGWRVPEREAWSNSYDLFLGYPKPGRTPGYYALYDVNYMGHLWSCEVHSDSKNAYPYFMEYYNSDAYENYTSETYLELSVRCVKDAKFAVTTYESLDITESAATLKGKVEVKDETHIEVRGFVYRENSSDLNTNDSAVTVIESDGQDDEFSAAVTGLKPNTTYYYRAFAKGNYNVRYGETKSFKTNLSGTGDGFNDGGQYDWE